MQAGKENPTRGGTTMDLPDFARGPALAVALVVFV